MNFREGMRRLGILLGVCGGVVGGCLGYLDETAVWNRQTAYRRFASLMASPTIQKVAKSTREYQNGPWVNHRSNEWTGRVDYDSKDGSIWEDVEFVPDQPFHKNRFGDIAVHTRGKNGFVGSVSPSRPTDIGGLMVSVNIDEIREVEADRFGTINSIVRSTGEAVHRADQPSLKAYLTPLMYPVFGFLLPWAAVRVLAWVGSGFFVRPQ